MPNKAEQEGLLSLRRLGQVRGWTGCRRLAALTQLEWVRIGLKKAAGE